MLRGAVCGADPAECPRRHAARQPRLHQILARLRGGGQRHRPRERPAAAASASAAATPAPAARLALASGRPRPVGAGTGGLQRRPLPLFPSSGKRRLWLAENTNDGSKAKAETWSGS